MSSIKRFKPVLCVVPFSGKGRPCCQEQVGGKGSVASYYPGPIALSRFI